MKRELSRAFGMAVLFSVSCFAASGPTGDVRFVGTYAQFRQTPEHAYGYALELWREGTTLVGFWERADGQEADFPTVRTTALQFDEASGALSFSASWCDYLVESFHGTLKGDTLEGTLSDNAAARNETMHLVLRRIQHDVSQDMPRAEWKARVDATLKRLGPRCSD